MCILYTTASVAKCCIIPIQATVQQYPHQILAEMANIVLNMETGELLEYRQLMKNTKFVPDWNISSANEFGMLATGIGNQTKNTSNTIFLLTRKKS